MENRNIIKVAKDVTEVIGTYSEEISDLRHTTSCIAHEVLGRPPSFWAQNAEATLAVLHELDSIVEKRDGLDKLKDDSINEFSNKVNLLNE
jgi:hypothetical protein